MVKAGPMHEFNGQTALAGAVDTVFDVGKIHRLVVVARQNQKGSVDRLVAAMVIRVITAKLRNTLPPGTHRAPRSDLVRDGIVVIPAPLLGCIRIWPKWS